MDKIILITIFPIIIGMVILLSVFALWRAKHYSNIRVRLLHEEDMYVRQRIDGAEGICCKDNNLLSFATMFNRAWNNKEIKPYNEY